MKLFKHYLTLFALTSILFIGCKPTDSEFAAKIQKTLNSSPETSNVTADVKDGTATLNGEVKSKEAKEKATKAAKDVNGIKNVENRVTIAAVAESPVQINADSTLIQGVKDATKDFPGVTANVNDGVIVLTGDIKRSDLQSLMMSLNTLKAKKIENHLTIK